MKFETLFKTLELPENQRTACKILYNYGLVEGKRIQKLRQDQNHYSYGWNAIEKQIEED